MTLEKNSATAPEPAPLPRLRVSVVEYLNTAPLVWGLDKDAAGAGLELKKSLPSQCADDLRSGNVDMGIIPVIEYQRIPGLKILPGVSVASENKVESVLLISRGPVRKAKRVALDTSSRTSVALTKILFAHHWRFEPEFIEAAPDLRAMLSDARAALLIGDPALQFALRSKGGELDDWARNENLHVYDLAEEWRRLTNLPFVFAMWTVRAGLLTEPGQAQALTMLFHQARNEGLKHLEEIAQRAGLELNLSGGQLKRYLRQAIRYDLDERHRAGLELFFKYSHDLGLIDEVRPLEFLC